MMEFSYGKFFIPPTDISRVLQWNLASPACSYEQKSNLYWHKAWEKISVRSARPVSDPIYWVRPISCYWNFHVGRNPQLTIENLTWLWNRNSWLNDFLLDKIPPTCKIPQRAKCQQDPNIFSSFLHLFRQEELSANQRIFDFPVSPLKEQVRFCIKILSYGTTFTSKIKRNGS